MPATAVTHRGFPFQRLAKDAVYAFGLNILCTAFITLVAGGQNVYDNVVISMSIGTVAFFVIDVARLTIWGDNAQVKWLPFFAILIVAAPIAQFGGNKIAGAILGRTLVDLEAVASGQITNWTLFTFLATSAGTLFYAVRERAIRAEAAAANERAHAEATERQALQAQLQLLQAQIEPHMLFNTLANLQGMIAIDPDRAQVMLDQLIQYLRASLGSSRAKTTTLGQEFALMEAYLGLMSVRMGARLGYTLDLPADLRGAAIAPMLLQPMVENAIIHGLEPKIEGGHVRVGAARQGDMLVISVADTGLGLEAAPGKAGGTHLGVANTRSRLQALHGERATLVLEPNLPQGAIARLTLPVDPS